MITEDIAVSWKLHLRGYRIKYEPLCHVLDVGSRNIGRSLEATREMGSRGHEVLLHETF